MNSACSVASPNCLVPIDGLIPSFEGTVTSTGWQSIVTAIDWNNSCAFGYDNFSYGEARNCTYVCTITSDCVEQSPEVNGLITVIDSYTGGNICGPGFN